MSHNLFAEAKAKFKFPPGLEIEDYAMKQDAWMDHEQVVEAKKVTAAAQAVAAAHADSEAAKEKKKKHHLGNVTHSCAKEVTVSILTGND